MKTFNHTRIINMRSRTAKEWITNKTAEIKKNFTSQKLVHMNLECNEHSMEGNQLDKKRDKKVTLNCSNKRYKHQKCFEGSQ